MSDLYVQVHSAVVGLTASYRTLTTAPLFSCNVRCGRGSTHLMGLSAKH